MNHHELSRMITNNYELSSLERKLNLTSVMQPPDQPAKEFKINI